MHEVTNKIRYLSVAKGAIVVFLPLLALAVGMTTIAYFVQTGSQREAMETEEKEAVEYQQRNILHDMESATRDLLFLAQHPLLEELFQNQRSIESDIRTRLEKELVLFAETQGLYDQIRLLDENGMEIVRVNFIAGISAAVPESELQNKKGRYYFEDTFLLDQGEVFVSPLDLNIEQGRIEQPLKPMLRFGTPVFDKQGRKRGIAILNYPGAHILQRFTDVHLRNASRSMLLNSAGYYLKGLKSEDEWGFMYEDRKDRVFGRTYPNVWRRIESARSGQINTGAGLFTFTTVYPLQHGQKSSSGSGNASGAGTAGFDAKEYQWKIVSLLPADVLYAESSALRRWLLRILAILATILGGGSWWFMWALVRRRSSEEALKESEEKFRTITSSAQDAIILMGEKGDVSYWNPAAEKIFGYTGPEILGKDLHTAIVPEPYREEFRKSFEIIQERGEGAAIGKLLELNALRKDGTEFPVELSLSAVKVDGKWNVIGIIRDISERRKADGALRRSEKRYRVLFESAADAIFVRDPESDKFLDLNKAACEFSGYSREELLQMTPKDLVPPGYAINIPKITEEVLERGRALFDTVLAQAGGATLPVEVSQLVIEYGERPAILSMIRDISERRRAEEERKRLEEQLKQVQKMEAIGTLSGGIAHEFNNIIGIIIGNTELAMDDVPEWNPARHNLNEIRVACMRVRDVVRQILAFSRQNTEELKPVRISPIVTESLKLLRSSIPTTIEIQQNILTDSGTVLADSTQISQVLINLCTNAAHAMREKGGVLEVSLENVDLVEVSLAHYHDLSPGKHLKLTVRDTGHGIPPEITERIFDPYFTTKEVGEGSGMGLAVVQGIVKVHGGDITVSSEPGKGTTFQVLLPSTECEPEPEIEKAVEIPRGRNERILFVDDEKAMVEAIQPMLERLGYQVTARTSSIEALEAFRAKPDRFDLVLTDHNIYNMTGAELAKEILNVRPDIPIILCTGYSEQMNEERAKEMGIGAFIMKPISMRDMAGTIRHLLDQKGGQS